MSDRIAEAFRAAGFDIFLVGGSVRDEILGVPSKDQDYCTNALPADTFNVLNGLGMGRPYSIGARFGTIGLNGVEVTTYRTEQYKNKNRKPDVQFGTDLHGDLARRDFTINSIAKDAVSGTYIDPFDGQTDLENGVIRCVGNPDERFTDDPLRMLRAIRFACRLGFLIDQDTNSSIQKNATSILSISQERIRDELSKILLSNVSLGIYLLLDTNLLGLVAPELMMLTDKRPQGKYHHLSLLKHTIQVAASVSDDLVLKWAAVLHDIGKFSSRTEDISGNSHYYGHDHIGALIADSVLTRLRYPNEIVFRVVRLVKCHMQVNFYKSEWSDGTVRKLINRLDDDIFLGIELAKADQDSHVQGHHDPMNELEQRVLKLQMTIYTYTQIPLDGNELMNWFDLPPGPWIKKVKQHLEELVIQGQLDPNDKDTALEIAAGVLAQDA